MKKTIKRLLGLLLAVSLVVGMVPGFVMAKGLTEGAATKLYTIKELNKNSYEGSHAGDNHLAVYMETNLRETMDMNGSTVEGADSNDITRYKEAYYPRIKKVKDDLYMMFWQRDADGMNLYYATSPDAKTWSTTTPIWSYNTRKVTYKDGSLSGQEAYLYGCEVDACVLENGDVLCVFAVYPQHGKAYSQFADESGIWMCRFTVGAGNAVSMSNRTQIYSGSVQQPFARRLADGTVELYWSDISDAANATIKRMTSADNGATWETANVTQLLNGQMPTAATLLNDKTLLAAKTSSGVSLAQNGADGAWTDLGVESSGDGPYLTRFPSGEAYLTYTKDSYLWGSVVSSDGTAASNACKITNDTIEGVSSSAEIVSGHEVITVARSGTADHGIRLTHSYLNHRISAGKTPITVGGDTTEWADITDAFFVGSQSRAQVTMQVSQDDDNIYLLLNRADEDLRNTDFARVCIADEKNATSYYELTLYVGVNDDGKSVVLRYRDTNESLVETNTSQDLSVARTNLGTIEKNVENTGDDTGTIFEVKIPKSLVGLTGKNSFKSRLALHNADWDVTKNEPITFNDSFDGVDINTTTNWPTVVLECDHSFSDGVCTLCGEKNMYTNKYVSKDGEGYVLTLEAYGKGNITNLSQIKPADIVLVLDVSASMYTPAGATGTVARLEKTGETSDIVGSDGKPKDKYITKLYAEDAFGQCKKLSELDSTKGEKLGYYIAHHTGTRRWWLLEYKNGKWVGYKLSDRGGTNSQVLVEDNGAAVTEYYDPDQDVIYDAKEITEAQKNEFDPVDGYMKHTFSDAEVNGDALRVWKTQYGALYDSVNAFVEKLKDSKVQHRVAITTFCGLANTGNAGSTGEPYTAVYNGANTLTFWNLYGGSLGTGGVASYTHETPAAAASAHEDFLSNTLKSVQDSTQYGELQTTMNTIVTNGVHTSPGTGIRIANAVLASAFPGNESKRDRIVLLFTDGSPNTDISNNHASPTSARNDSVKQAYIAKKDYGATVFSIYTSTVEASTNEVFLQVTSSMYPDATHYAVQEEGGSWKRDKAAWGDPVTDKEYCFQATNDESLSVAFNNISTSVSSSATNLDSTAVLRDVLSDYFDLRGVNGTVAESDIKVYTADYLGNNTFAAQESFGATVKLGYSTASKEDADGDGRVDSVSVSGFDYKENYVHEATTEQTAGGKKLIVKIPIKVRDGFWGGNGVITNENANSGLYSSDVLGLTRVAGLPVPELNVQAAPTINVRDISQYYGGSASWVDVLTGITVDGVGVTITDDGTCSPSEGWMDDYATLTWTGYENVINNKTVGNYNFTVTLTPNTGTALTIPVEEGGATTTETVEVSASEAKTVSGNSTVHILTPVISFQDSTIYTGFKPDNAYFDKHDFVKIVKWLNEEGSTASGVIVGAEPTLTYDYLPEDSSFEADTGVHVTVTSSNGNEDITAIVTFKWNLCAEHGTLAQITEHKGNVESYEFWVHVSDTKAMNDTVVIDFGLKVEIDVIANDIQPPESNYKLLGISRENVPDQFSTAAVNGAFGTLTMADGKVVYTLSNMQMNVPEIFYYVAECEYGLFYGTITVIPATTVYFEDDFDGFNYEVYKYNGTTWNKDTSAAWLVDGTAADGTQKEDRPGIGNDYGYDAAYGDSAQLSMGAAHYIVVDSSTYGIVNFTFCGTGFDIISRTSADTGFITINVYKIEGESKTRVKRLGVDTYYSTADGLYQVPVMKVDDLDYGIYQVEIKSAYNSFLDHNADDANYRFYLDGVRVYDPVGVLSGETNDTVSGAYDADGENYPIYEEVRDNLINAGSFGELTVESEGTTTQITGGVFVDLTDGAGAAGSIQDYQNVGPNNEVYLAPGQSIAFNIGREFVNEAGNAVSPVDVQIGLKSVGGSVSVELFNPGDSGKTNLITKTLNTATDMYYSIGKLMNGTIVITNTGGSGMLSITNLKVTFDEKVTVNETTTLMTISEMDAVSVLRSLVGYSPEEETTLPTITPTGASVSLEDEINYNVMFTVTNPDSLEITEMGLISWTEKIDGTMDNAAFVSTIARTYGADGWQVQSQPIAAKDMGQELYFKVYLKLADGSYVYSTLLHCSTRTYCNSILANEAAEDGLKALCVALMNYGAAAQTYFGYKTDELMNAGLTDEQKALVSDYTDDMVPVLVPAGEKGAELSGNGGYTNVIPSVTLGGALAINYYFTPGFTADNGMKLYVWTAEDYGRLESLTLENAAQVHTMTADGNSYVGSVTDIAAKNAGDTVYVCGVYECNGVSYYTGVLACSVSAYCKSFAGNTSVWPLASATAVYGYYANAYFG